MKDYQEILPKLSLLRRKDKNFQVFGSRGHRYKLAPTLSEQQIQDFEKK